MATIRTLVVLSAITLLSACAAPGRMKAAHDMSTMNSGSATAPEPSMEPRMRAMQDMHQKMMDAKTPAERQALMADHMKAMQGGMAMMKEMHAKPGAGDMSGMACMSGMGAVGKDMPADMGRRHQMMGDHMAMMEMMMQMMMDRMPS